MDKVEHQEFMKNEEIISKMMKALYGFFFSALQILQTERGDELLAVNKDRKVRQAEKHA